MWIPSVAVNGAFVLTHRAKPGTRCWWDSVIGTITERTYTASPSCAGAYGDVVYDLAWEVYYLSGTTWYARLRGVGYSNAFWGWTALPCDDVETGVTLLNTITCTGFSNWGANGSATIELP